MRKVSPMNGEVPFAVWIVIVILTLTGCVSTAEFNSLDISNSDDPQALRGKLTKPAGDGPFPAIVLLHGCGGPGKHYSAWTERLRRWGYVSVMVDSFGPRGASNCWSDQGKRISPSRRALDAHGAKLFLAGLPCVD